MSRREDRRTTRRQVLSLLSAALSALGVGKSAAQSTVGRLRAVPLRDIARIDAAEGEGWLTRDRTGRLWQLGEDGASRQLGEGLEPSGSLAVGHGRIAGRALDGRLWVLPNHSAGSRPQYSSDLLAPHGGLCVLPLAVMGLVEHAGRTWLARFEPDARGLWRVVARSEEAVLPDAVPVVADLAGRADGGHIAVLAGPDRKRYPHAVLGDDVEATRVIWLERHELKRLRALSLDEPEVFEDRLLRPWRLPDGRIALVTMRSGPLGAQLAVVAASTHDASALELAAVGPFIGTRNRWLAPASVDRDGGAIWAVHTPHLGGVLHRYRATGTQLQPERTTTGFTNHRIGDRDLDVSARTGRWLLLPTQTWQGVGIVDLEAMAVVSSFATDAPILQLVTSASGRSVALLSQSGLALWSA